MRKPTKDGIWGSSPSPAGGDQPWAACVLSLPASCSRCPSCSQGLRRLTGQRAARQGEPAPRHQVPLPIPATRSRRLSQRAQTGTPAAGVERPHSLQEATGKRSLAPQPLKGTASSTGPEAGMLQPRRGSPGEQLGAEIRVLQQVGLLLRGRRLHFAHLDPRGPGPLGGGSWGPHAGVRRGCRRRRWRRWGNRTARGAGPQAPTVLPWLRSLPEGTL